MSKSPSSSPLSNPREAKKRVDRSHSKSDSENCEESVKGDSPYLERSASPEEKQKKRHKGSTRRKKRSRSYSPRGDDRGSRDSKRGVDVSHCLGVFGLSSVTEERELKEVFGAYGDIDKLCLIYDKQSGHSKGFAFVYYKSTEDAIKARKETQGLVLNGRPIRVDYSLTLQPHSPTPGRYRGRRRHVYGYSSSYKRYGDDYSYRSRNYGRSSYDDRYKRNRSDRDEYDDCYDRSTSRKYSPYSRRH